MNPIYAQLRDAAWNSMQSGGGQLDPRVLASLDRARDIPPEGRFVMVDTAGARLYMIEDGRIADSMKVIVGKADPSTQTPMLASTIYYATLNPYWHVSGEMVRSLIASNVLDQGLGYLKRQGYQVMSADGSATDFSIPRRSTGMRSPMAATRGAFASFPDPRTRWAGSSSASRTPTTSICMTRRTRTCSRQTTARSATAAFGWRMPSGSAAG